MFESSLPDIPRIYTALSEWVGCLICAYPFIRHKHQNFLLVAIVGIVGQIVLQLLVENWPLLLWIPGMLINIFWMGFSIHMMTQLPIKNTILVLVKAFVLSELIASVAWQFYVTFFINLKSIHSSIAEIFCFLLLFIIMGTVIYLLDKKINFPQIENSINNKSIALFLLTGIVIFLASNIGFLLTQTAYHLGNSYSIFFVRTVVNISGICLVYMLQYQLLDQNRQREVNAIQNLFHSQYQQYKAYAENTSYINRKAHDLKHQIQTILAEDDLSIRQQYLSDLSKAIENLNYKIETGNGVLDTILTRKNMYCQEHHISLTCIANGALLHNMEIMDICSLFGNALDNAIEHVEKISEYEKRLVTLKLQNKGKMVILRVDNYCIDEDLKFLNLPKTSKKDKENHGYGLKNIEYIAKKYRGDMTLELADNWFSLVVVFPIV